MSHPAPGVKQLARPSTYYLLYSRVSFLIRHSPLVLSFFLVGFVSVNSINVSSCGTIVAAGCADSSIRLWAPPQASQGGDKSPGTGENNASVLFLLRSFHCSCSHSFSLFFVWVWMWVWVWLWLIQRSRGNRKILHSQSRVASFVLERTRLLGHSGPVFKTSFSHDNQYLLSSSQDGTVRLWHVPTQTNLMVYRVSRSHAPLPSPASPTRAR